MILSILILSILLVGAIFLIYKLHLRNKDLAGLNLTWHKMVDNLTEENQLLKNQLSLKEKEKLPVKSHKNAKN